MKLKKILGLALAVLALTSCEENKLEDYPNFLGAVNTASGVTVSLEPTFVAQENQSTIFVPIKVTGKTNGKVVVTVAVKEGPASENVDPAKEIENYNVTSKTVNIPEGATEGFVEITPIWEQGVINNDCVFEMSIVKVEGATAEAGNCLVTIENVDNAYTMMLGSWTMTGVDRNGTALSWTITMSAPPAEDEDYGSFLMGFGFAKQADYLVPFTDFQYDEVLGKGTIMLGVGKMMTDGLAFNYGDPVGNAFPVCMLRTAQGVTINGEVELTFDSDMNEIVFPQDVTIFAGLYGLESREFTGYSVGQISQIKMTR